MESDLYSIALSETGFYPAIRFSGWFDGKDYSLLAVGASNSCINI